MSIDVMNEQGSCSIRIEDEMTIYTASSVTATIRDALAANDSVAIDVSGVTEIDTAGLQILLVARKEAMLKNRAVRFVGQNRVVDECLQLMNLANFFQFEAPAALAA